MTHCNSVCLNCLLINRAQLKKPSLADISTLTNCFSWYYRTYFIEYEFPVGADHGSGQSDKNDVGLEITRIATKKTSEQSKYVVVHVKHVKYRIGDQALNRERRPLVAS